MISDRLSGSAPPAPPSGDTSPAIRGGCCGACRVRRTHHRAAPVSAHHARRGTGGIPARRFRARRGPVSLRTRDRSRIDGGATPADRGVSDAVRARTLISRESCRRETGARGDRARARPRSVEPGGNDGGCRDQRCRSDFDQARAWYGPVARRTGGGHGVTTAGRVTTNSLPCPTTLSASTRPSCNSTRRLTSASPIPKPPVKRSGVDVA